MSAEHQSTRVTSPYRYVHCCGQLMIGPWFALRALVCALTCLMWIAPEILPAIADEKVPPGADAAILRNHYIEPTRAGVATYFESLSSLETRRAWQTDLVAALIDDLDHEDWTVRDAATETLATMPVRSRPILTETLNADDLEIVWRARRVLDRIKSETYETALDQGRIIEAVCRVIEHQPIRGVAPVLLKTMKDIRQKYVLGNVRRALAATAGPDDADLLRKALESDPLETKVAAILALGGALGAEAKALLRPHLADADPRVKAAAAHALAELGDRTALPVLVDLLSVDSVRVRSESIRVLRALTGQYFEYAAYDELSDQETAIGKWRQWTETEGSTADLNFPFKLEIDEFEAFLGTVSAYSCGGAVRGRAHFAVNGRPWGGGADDFGSARGITVLAIHRGRGLLLRSYDTYGRGDAADAFADALADLPTGCFVLLGVMDEGTMRFNANGQRAIESIGGAINLQGPSRGSHYRAAYLCIGYKGLAHGYAVEKLAPGSGPVRFLPR